jgi:hypothetical protein
MDLKQIAKDTAKTLQSYLTYQAPDGTGPQSLHSLATGSYSVRDARCFHRTLWARSCYPIKPESDAWMRPFARLQRLRALRLPPRQGRHSRPTSSHLSMAASVPVRLEGSTYRIPCGDYRHGSSPSNPLHQPTHGIPVLPHSFLSPPGPRRVSLPSHPSGS